MDKSMDKSIGGSLYQSPVFNDILSIGYEFETHDLTKLSLHENNKWLINSDFTLRVLKERKEVGNIVETDPRDKYITVRIPIHRHMEQKGGEGEGVEEEGEDEEEGGEEDEEELMRQLQEEYGKEYELDKISQWENEKYKDYVNENRKTDFKTKALSISSPTLIGFLKEAKDKCLPGSVVIFPSDPKYSKVLLDEAVKNESAELKSFLANKVYWQGAGTATGQSVVEDKAQSVIEDKAQSVVEDKAQNKANEGPFTATITCVKKLVAFNITNDLGETGFDEILGKYCKNMKIHKNDMYAFKEKLERNQKQKLFKFKFAEPLKDCEVFSGVEYIITYYEPKRGPNLVLETYIDACSRIIDHLSDLKVREGQLLVDIRSDYEKTGYYSPVGVLDEKNKRRIYKKPNTNLYYMDIYDDKNTRTTKSFEQMEFIPQMTFRCDSKNALPIMREILKANQSEILTLITRENKFKRPELDLYFVKEVEVIDIIDNMVNKLFARYNERNTSRHIAIDTDIGIRLKTYVFFIFFKLFNFIVNHSKILSGEDYLKDNLTFASRHTNYDFYVRIKEIFRDQYTITDAAEIHSFFYQPDILDVIYESLNEKDPGEGDFTEDGDYKFEDAFNVKTELDISDPNYGNPLFSLSSYFKHFEEPKDDPESKFKAENDWLISAKKDISSTTFELTGDIMLMENRIFRYEIEYLLNILVGTTMDDGIVNIGQMRDVVSKVDRIYNFGAKKSMMFSKEPFKPQFTKKNKGGYKPRGKTRGNHRFPQ